MKAYSLFIQIYMASQFTKWEPLLRINKQFFPYHRLNHMLPYFGG